MSRLVRDSLKKAVKGTAFVFLSMVVSILIWFVDRIIIVRSTTIEEMGLYSMAVAVASVVALLAALGLHEGSTRYISFFIGEGREEDARRVARTTLRIGFLSGLTASFLMYLTAGPAAMNVFYMPELVGPLRAMAPFPLFFVLVTLLVGIVRGFGDVWPRVLFVNIGQPLFFLFFLMAFMVLGLPFISIIFFYVATVALSTVFSLRHARSRWGVRLFSFGSGGFRREMLAFSLPLLAGALISILFSRTDTLMVGRYMNAEAVGVYNVAASMASLLGFAVNSMGFVLLPIAGDLYARNHLNELKRSFQVLTKWVFAVTFPMFFIVFFFPEMCVTFIFGLRYESAAGPLSVLSIGYLVYVFVGASNTLLTVMGLTRHMMAISFLVMVLNIVLNYLFIKVLGYGILGTAWATTASFLVYGILNTLLLYTRSGIQPFTFNYTKPLLAASAIGLLIYAVAKILPLSFWMLPLYLALFIIGYSASILATRSIEREDLDMLEAIGRRTGVDTVRVRKFLERFHVQAG